MTGAVMSRDERTKSLKGRVLELAGEGFFTAGLPKLFYYPLAQIIVINEMSACLSPSYMLTQLTPRPE